MIKTRKFIGDMIADITVHPSVEGREEVYQKKEKQMHRKNLNRGWEFMQGEPSFDSGDAEGDKDGQSAP